MPRSTKDNEEIRAARRREILAAATAVFAEKGLANAKVTDIAAAANLSHGLLYHYFPSKEAVFEAIVEQMMRRTDEALDVPQGRAIERLRHSLIRSQESLATDSSVHESRIVTVALLMGDSISDELRERLSTHLQTLLQRSRAMIAEAQADGDLDDRVSTDELSRMFLFLFRGMAIRIPGFEIPLPEASILLDLLRPNAAPVSTQGRKKGTGAP